MKKLLIIVTLVTSFYSLQRINDYSELSEMIFVNSMGVDYDNNKKEFIIYFYILNNYNLAIPDISSSNNEDASYINVGRGKTIDEAINLIKNNSNLMFHFSNTQTFIIKNTFCINDNLEQLCHYILNSNEVVPNAVIFFTDDEIKDIYQITTYSQTSSYFTLIVNSMTQNNYLKVYFNELCKDVLTPNYTAVYPFIKVNEDILIEFEEPQKSIAVEGIAVLDNQNSCKSFLLDDYPFFIWLNPLSNTTQYFHFGSFKVKEYKISKKYKKDYFKIKIHISFYLTTNPLNITELEALHMLYEEIYEELMKLYDFSKETNYDFYNINHLSYDKANFTNTNIKIIINSREIKNESID